MSGIYIPGMEMPTTCFECPFMFARRYCCADLTLDLYQGDYEELKGRVDGCPLVPVSPHGRLIDADALDADLERQDMRTGEYDAIGFSIDEIENAPTIIEADKEV